MAKEFTGVGSDGGVGYWQGSLADFKDDLGKAELCGFTTGDREYEREWDAETVLEHAEGMERGFGHVSWTSDEAGRVVLLVLGS